MNATLRDILDELYAIDPALAERETDLIPIIEKLLAHNPGRKPDPEFVKELRRTLQQSAADLSPSHFSLPSPMKFLYLFGGALAAVIIAVPATYVFVHNTPAGTPAVHTTSGQADFFAYSVTPTAGHAFGNLSQAMPGATVRGQGGGSGPAAATAPAQTGEATAANQASPMNSKMDARMIAPYNALQYTYTYDGSLPALSDSVSVLERQPGKSSFALSSLFSSFNISSIDMGTFQNATVDSINAVQKTPFGYYINVQLTDGSVSLSQNWDTWPHPDVNCSDDACFQKYRLSMSDIPADDTLIGIAQAFVKDHGIDVSHYDQPEVDNRWRVSYDQAPDQSQQYVPDQLAVIYPLLVEGKPVYDEGGGKTGISISVSIRDKKVANVWGIQSQSYLSSAYDGVTDSSAIMNYLKTIDSMMPMPLAADTGIRPNGQAKTVTVVLGEPTVAYATFMLPGDKGQMKQLIVPSLIFPVKNAPSSDVYFRQTIIVPLAKDLLDQVTKQRFGGMGGGVMPMAK